MVSGGNWSERTGSGAEALAVDDVHVLYLNLKQFKAKRWLQQFGCDPAMGIHYPASLLILCSETFRKSFGRATISLLLAVSLSERTESQPNHQILVDLG